MGDYGLKIAKTGYDVLTTGDNNLVFSSKFNSLKEYLSGILSADVTAGGTQTVTVAHGLSYAPSFLVYNDGDDSYWHYANSGGLQFYVSPDYEQVFAWSDATNLNIVLQNAFGVGTETRRAKYYIFKDEAS